MSMILRRVNHRNWVNVGDGNVTSVVDISRNPVVGTAPEPPRVLINMLSGGQLEIPGCSGEDVVKSLESIGGFGR